VGKAHADKKKQLLRAIVKRSDRQNNHHYDKNYI